MAFIPSKSIKIGDIVYLTKDVSVLSGMFEEGTKMTIKGYSGIRGWDLVDDFGNKLLECSSSNFTKTPPEKGEESSNGSERTPQGLLYETQNEYFGR